MSTLSPAPDFDLVRFRELTLYVADKCAGDVTFGATKLNKIMFYGDFIAYAMWGQPLTGATYQKLSQGPAPRQYLPMITELESKREAAIATRDHFGRTQKRLIPLREPDLSPFSALELNLVNDVIEWLWGKSAADVSDLSHIHRGYRLVELNEDIPYWTVFIDPDQALSENDIQWAQSIAAEHGLVAAQ